MNHHTDLIYESHQNGYCKLDLNQTISYWYSFALLIFSCLVIIVSIIKLIIHYCKGEDVSSTASRDRNEDEYHALVC